MITASSSSRNDRSDKFASMDIITKCHVKWDIEGDENSKFSMGLINKKGGISMINEIMVERKLDQEPLFDRGCLPFNSIKEFRSDSQGLHNAFEDKHRGNGV
ncbi:hypothetical protein Tco_0373824 [Tanacetum coccineum]